MNTDFWNARYREEGFAYGADPNRYFAEKLRDISPGTLLLPAEGEGRQAVFAAQLGWGVTAFDPSDTGRDKAMDLALVHNQTIAYEVCDAQYYLEHASRLFDAVVFIYSHFPGDNRVELHRQLAQLVKPGGHVIIEVFAKGHEDFNSRDPRVGGPRDSAMLFSEEEVKHILNGFQWLELTTEEVELNEGKYHVGTGLVVRVLARRNSDFTE